MAVANFISESAFVVVKNLLINRLLLGRATDAPTPAPTW